MLLGARSLHLNLMWLEGMEVNKTLFSPCEVDAVHLGFRLSCFTPLPLWNSKGGILTATWPTRVL